MLTRYLTTSGWLYQTAMCSSGKESVIVWLTRDLSSSTITSILLGDRIIFTSANIKKTDKQTNKQKGHSKTRACTLCVSVQSEYYRTYIHSLNLKQEFLAGILSFSCQPNAQVLRQTVKVNSTKKYTEESFSIKYSNGSILTLSFS